MRTVRRLVPYARSASVAEARADHAPAVRGLTENPGFAVERNNILPPDRHGHGVRPAGVALTILAVAGIGGKRRRDNPIADPAANTSAFNRELGE